MASLRVRLLCLVLLAMVPALLLIVYTVTVQVSLDALPPVRGDRSQMMQILVKLANNAVANASMA